MDVALGLHPGVAVEPVQRAAGEAPRPPRAPGIAQRGAVGRERREQRNRVGAGPFARFPGLIPADRAAGGEAEQRAPVADADFGLEAGPAPAEPAHATVGHVTEDRATLQPLIDAIEQLVETGGEQAREQARLRTEAPPGIEQRASSLRALPSHGAFMEIRGIHRNPSASRRARGHEG